MEISFSREQQLANLNLFERLWHERVTPGQVLARLSNWSASPVHTCGTAACAGGHLATWPEFHALGVERSSDDGAPLLAGLDVSAYETARILFGDRLFFCTRGFHRADPPDDEPGVSDYDVVLRRVERQRRELLAGL